MILNRTHPRRRAAFTLLEMVVVMWALGMALALGTALIVTAQKSVAIGDTASERIVLQSQLARQFRQDVARAESVPDRFGEYAAGPDCLILKIPDGSIVVYRREKKIVDRTELMGDRKSVQHFALDKAENKTEFVRPAGGKGVVKVVITESNPKGPDRVSQWSAALAGDLR